MQAPVTDPESPSLKPSQWLAVYLVLTVNVVWANWLSPFPWGNDFEGLGLTTTLMDREGWQYCISDNWGFAHTSLHYLLTKLTGDLWLSSRLICALSLFLLIFWSEKVMRSTFAVRSPRVRTFFLIVLSLSPLVTNLSLCYYLETVAITLFMAALSLLGVRRPAMHIVGGLVATAGAWFRFHFLVYGVVYAVMVYSYRNNDRPKLRACWSALGSCLAVLVSAGVCKMATGSWGTSNLKAVLAAWTPDYSWDIGYQVRLNLLSYNEIWRQFDWQRMLSTFAKTWLINPHFVITCCLLLGVFLLMLQRESSMSGEAGSPQLPQRVCRALQQPLVGIMTCILLAIVPFMVIRGELNYKLAADLLIFTIPWLAGIYAHCSQNRETLPAPVASRGIERTARRNRIIVQGLVLMATIAVLVPPTPLTYAFYSDSYQSWRRIDGLIDGSIPQAVREQTPEAVLCTIYHPNKANRYWQWRPVTLHGWPTRSAAFRHYFGFPLNNIAELARTGKVRYIITQQHAPDVQLIPKQAIKQVHGLGDVVVLELRSQL